MAASPAAETLDYRGHDGLGLVATAYGPPQGAPVLLLHGGGQSRGAWTASGKALAAAGFRVIALDMRGHGDSEWAADGHYTLDAFADDLRAVAATLDRPPVVVGASLGGLAALLAIGEAPAMAAAAVVLVDIVPWMEKRGGDQVVGFMRGTSGGFDTLEQAAAAIADYLPHRPQRERLDGLARTMRRKANGRWYWHWDPAFVRPQEGWDMDDINRRLSAATSAVGVPLMLVHGTNSEIVSADGAARVRELLPEAEIVPIPGAHHMVAGDDNDAFLEAILPFVAAHAAGDDGNTFIVPSREESMARLMRGYTRVAGFARDLPYTTADRLEERAVDAGEQPFILFEDQAISYAAMNARANRVAHAALAAGLVKGDVVALLMLNRPEFVLMWLGLTKAGIVTALLNTSAAGDILSHALRQVAAKALIVGSELAGTVAAMPAAALPGLIFEQSEQGDDRSAHGWRDLDAAMANASDANPDRAARAGIVMADPLYLIFTSGTTGLPKAAKMSHMRYLNAGEMMAGLMEFGADDTFYCVLPLYHGAGGMVVPSVAMATGRPFVLRRKFSRTGFWADVRRHRITAVYYIGEVIRYLLATPPAADDRDHSLRVMTGAGLKPDVWAAFTRRFGIRNVIEGLGSTEANYGITNADNRIGSVGRLPYPQATNIRILKYDVERGEHARDGSGGYVQAAPHEVGEIVAEVLDGTGVGGFFEGYTSAEATEAKLIRDLFTPGDRWFRSGDLVRFDEDDYFFFVDRVGDTFRWKSENVSTAEVETILAGFSGPSVINVYGVSIPGTEGRAGMVALTYPEDVAFDPRAFFAFVTAHLAQYAMPLFVRLTATADMTTTFKLRKVESQREGYDPVATAGDPLFVIDPAAATYVPLDAPSLARLDIPPFKGADHAR